VPQTTRTHLFTDLRGYGRLVHERGDAAALKVLRTYARVVKAALPKRGVVMEQTADSFYLVFNSPMDAVRSAVAIADAAAAHNSAHPDLPIRVAAGMEAGQTVRHAGGNAGAAPVVANRISDRARAGQVLLGEAAAALVRPFKVPLRDLGMTRLHDGQAMHVFEARPPFPGEVQPADRFLTTVLFTDIVQSTATATRRGREGWRELFERHHAIVREQLRRHRGVEVDTAGDGFFASIDTPSHAIDCARAIRDQVKAEVDIDIRAGVHVGECELVADKVGGIGVFVGARIKDLGGAGEILVSQAVKDVMLGSTIEFAEHGRVMLKGVPGEWTVYRVV
jgi:class 3 adenylate cyclase